MYTHLHIRNFRGLRAININNLAMVTIFAGKNNTGKTALLEALFLLACGPLAGQFALTALRQTRGEGPPGADPTTESTPWDTIFYEFDSSQPISLKVRRSSEDVELRLERSVLSKSVSYSTRSLSSADSYSRELHVQLRRNDVRTDYIQRLIVSVSPGVALGSFAPNVQLNNYSLQFKIDPPAEPLDIAVFVGPRLRATPQELADRYSKIKMRGADKEIAHALRLIEPRLERLEILVSNGQPALHLDLGPGPLYPLTVLGEGISSMVDFLTSIQSARGGIVLIDEIENGIHHSVLKDLWVQLYRAAERSQVQIFATTHSQECVEAAQEALGKRENQLRLIRLRRPKSSQETIEAVEYDQDALEGAITSQLDVR